VSLGPRVRPSAAPAAGRLRHELSPVPARESRRCEVLRGVQRAPPAAGGSAQLAPSYAALQRSLSESLEQQTATSEILRVISRSPTDVQPVFDAIVQSASSLCEAEFSAVVRFEDGLLHLAGTSNVSSVEIEAYQSLFPRPPRRDFIMGRAFLDGRPVHVE